MTNWREQAHRIVWLDHTFFFDAATMRSGPCILDIGALTLKRIQMYRRLWPGCGIVGYEANPEAYAELKPASGPRAVRIHNAALAPVSGMLKFYVLQHPGMSALEPWHDTKGVELDRVCEIPGKTLADIIRENGLGRIDLMVLNCEGAELWPLIAIATRRDLRDQIRQILVSFHCSKGHLLAYPRELRDGIIASLAQDYAVFPGRRNTQWFLFVRQERL